MDRRKFLTRLAQIAAGAVAVKALPRVGGIGQALADPLPAPMVTPIPFATIAEVEAALMEFWAVYSRQPSAIVMSEDYFDDLARLSGFNVADLHQDRRFEVAGVQIIRDKWLPVRSAYRLNPDTFKLHPPRHIITQDELNDEAENIHEVKATPSAEGEEATRD